MAPLRAAAQRHHHAAGVVAVLLAVLLSAAPALAADPTPTGAQAVGTTCAERYPEPGPAGVDLRLGCIVSEVVGLYTADRTPPPLSTYAILVGIVIVAGGLLAWIAGRLVARRAARRLAPVTASAWWLCGECRSVNAVGVQHCYACGSRQPDGPLLQTDDQPGTPQSFGAGRRRG